MNKRKRNETQFQNKKAFANISISLLCKRDIRRGLWWMKNKNIMPKELIENIGSYLVDHEILNRTKLDKLFYTMHQYRIIHDEFDYLEFVYLKRDIEFIDYIIRKRKPCIIHCVFALYGDLKMMKYAHETHDCQFSCMVNNYAARQDNMEIPKYLIEQRKYNSNCGTLRSCIQYTGLTMLKYYVSVGKIKPTMHEIYSAIQYNKVNCLQYLQSHDIDWNFQSYIIGFKYKSHDCIDFLLENGCPWIDGLCSYASKYGDLKSLMSLHLDYNFEIDEETIFNAACNGHLNCVEYLHLHKCKWDVIVTSGAAKNNHPHILKYLFEKGCPMDWTTIREACVNKSDECLQYLMLNGCEVIKCILKNR